MSQSPTQKKKRVALTTSPFVIPFDSFQGHMLHAATMYAMQHKHKLLTEIHKSHTPTIVRDTR